MPRPSLAIDTATSRTVAQLGTVDGEPAGRPRTASSSRGDGRAPHHGRELLAAIDAAVRAAGIELGGLEAVVVGTGPGSFTGLRIGLATAKTIAHAASLPIVGIPTPAALAVAALRHEGAQLSAEVLVVQPAGPNGRYVSRVRVSPASGPGPSPEGLSYELLEPPRVAPSTERLAELSTQVVVAVDLAPEDLPVAALALGDRALDGLGEALLELGRSHLLAGGSDDVAELVPVYVTLPRGVREVAEAHQLVGGSSMSEPWSPAPR